MRIALVRGPSLNPYEMQNEVPLISTHSLTAFATSYTPEWDQRLPELPVVRCFWPDRFMASAPRLRWLFNGMCSRVLGFSFHLYGLEAKLEGFDLIHSMETHTTYSFQAAQAADRYLRPLVVTVWETIPWRGESHPLRAARKRYVRSRANAFIAVTHRTAEMLKVEGVPAEKIHVIPMGIDQTHFCPRPADDRLRQSWNADPDEFTWLCVSRLVSEKGILDVIEAFASQKNLGRLVFIGKGPGQRGFEHHARRLGIQRNVSFAGSYPYTEMPSVYASGSALILASHTTNWWEEQFGYCLVEAMACGKPIVAASSGAIPEVVGDAAVFVEPRNPVLLGQKMKEMKDNVELRKSLTQRGLIRAQRDYTHWGIAGKIAALYASLA